MVLGPCTLCNTHWKKSMKEEMGSEETNFPSKPWIRDSHHVHSDAARETTSHAWPQHMSPPTPPPCVKGNNNISNNEIDVSMSSGAQYCYYMLEAMPQPGPTWSTTGPCVLAEPTPTPTLTPSALIEDSSYTCWLGYLEGFDGNLTTEKLDPPFVENVVMENAKGVFGYESTLVEAIDLSYCCPDDWLVIPTMEQDLEDIVMP